MKTMLIILMHLCFSFPVHAQVQEIEQLKINLEKLAQLKLMLSQAKQGYQTLLNGYNSVRDAARGNFDLHKNYLDQLLQVSTQVKNAPALKRLFANQTSVPKDYRNWYNQLLPLGLFNAAELTTIQDSYRKIESALSDGLDQLQLLLSPGLLRMSDGERITAIEALALQSDAQVALLKNLIREKTGVAVLRARDKKDVQTMKKLYGLQ